MEAHSGPGPGASRKGRSGGGCGNVPWGCYPRLPGLEAPISGSGRGHPKMKGQSTREGILRGVTAPVGRGPSRQFPSGQLPLARRPPSPQYLGKMRGSEMAPGRGRCRSTARRSLTSAPAPYHRHSTLTSAAARDHNSPAPEGRCSDPCASRGPARQTDAERGAGPRLCRRPPGLSVAAPTLDSAAVYQQSQPRLPPPSQEQPG